VYSVTYKLEPSILRRFAKTKLTCSPLKLILYLLANKIRSISVRSRSSLAKGLIYEISNRGSRSALKTWQKDEKVGQVTPTGVKLLPPLPPLVGGGCQDKRRKVTKPLPIRSLVAV
jgi:hypothetical protein